MVESAAQREEQPWDLSMCNDFGNNVPYSAYLEAFKKIRFPVVFPTVAPNLEPRLDSRAGPVAEPSRCRTVAAAVADRVPAGAAQEPRKLRLLRCCGSTGYP